MDAQIEMRVSKKEHTCSFCGAQISKQERYIYRTYKQKDKYINENICAECASSLLQEAFANKKVLKKFERLAKS